MLKKLLVAAHILRLNYAEMAGDRPRQPAYEIFSIEGTCMFNHLSFDILGLRRLQ